MRKRKHTNRKAVILIAVILFVFNLFSLQIFAASEKEPQDLGDDFSRYSGKTIGVSTGTVQEKYLMEKIPGAIPAYYETFADMCIALSDNKIDGFIVPYTLYTQLILEYDGLDFDPQKLADDVCGYIFSDTPFGQQLKQEMNEYIIQLREDGRLEEYTELTLDTEHPYREVVDISDLKDINGTVRIGISNTTMPFCYVVDQGLSGLDMLILHDFFKEKGYGVKIEPTSFASIIAGVTSGTYDLGAGGITYSKEREESVDFSEFYFEYPQVICIPAENQAKSTLIDKIKTGFYKTFIQETRWQLIANGLLTTLLITVSSFLFGALLGILVCRILMSKSRFGKKVMHGMSAFLQGTPVVVILMILYYVVFSATRISSTVVSIIGFMLLISCETGELYERSLTSIDKGQIEAGLAIGFRRKDCYINILIPQAMRSILLSFKNVFISLLKGTAIVGYIAVQDLTKMSDIIRSRTYDAFFPLITTAIIYFLISYLITLLFKRIGQRYVPSNRKRGVKGVKYDA